MYNYTYALMAKFCNCGFHILLYTVAIYTCMHGHVPSYSYIHIWAVYGVLMVQCIVISIILLYHKPLIFACMGVVRQPLAKYYCIVISTPTYCYTL